jgi:hypothetical protein
VCWKSCSSCWSLHLLREEFLSAPIHSPLSSSPYQSFTPSRPLPLNLKQKHTRGLCLTSWYLPLLCPLTISPCSNLSCRRGCLFDDAHRPAGSAPRRHTTPRQGPHIDDTRRPGRVRTSMTHDAPAGSAPRRRMTPQSDQHLDDA